MKIVKGGITKAQGFKANGLHCGIKRSGKLDLALIYCDCLATVAGVFTKNSIKAAPLIVTQKHLHNHRAQAIIVNSGNANCFTGNFGMIYAQKTAELFAKLLKIKTSDVLVASTGIIGRPLPFKKIKDAAPQLAKGLSPNHSQKAARAILTTDKMIKETAVQTTINGKTITLGGCAKGSGMIAPNMATMLAFITTDVAITAPMLKLALTKAAEKTFNCITVDGCMSTNDMTIVLANGLANNTMIRKHGKDFDKFYEALHFICLDLAKKIVLDGEGANKFIEVHVTGAGNDDKAKKVCFAIANSNLVKTAAYGSNPNWGRVAAAVGSLGLPITEKDMKIKFSSFAKKNIRISVDLNLGRHKATVYTSDLSPEYVKINGAYN